MSAHRKYELERYAMSQVSKWRRINNLIKKCKSVLEIEDKILAGDEESIRDFVAERKETRASLVEEAKKLHVKNYGSLTKGELINEIRKYKDNKISRQRFER